MARLTGPIVLSLVALQVVLAAIVPIITSTQLDKGCCYLNPAGSNSVCPFAYTTAGFSLFFSLLITAGLLATARVARAAPRAAFVPGECGSVAAFGTLFWLAAAITFTQRGKEAAAGGQPAGSARDAVIALSWLEFALFLLTTAAVAVERILHARYSAQAAAAAEKLLDAQDEETAQQQQHKLLQKQVSFELSPRHLMVTTAPSPQAAAPPAPEIAGAV